MSLKIIKIRESTFNALFDVYTRPASNARM